MCGNGMKWEWQSHDMMCFSLKLFCYWPESGESMLQFGPTNVLVESEKEEHLYTCRKIRLTNTKVVSCHLHSNVHLCLHRVTRTCLYNSDTCASIVTHIVVHVPL